MEVNSSTNVSQSLALAAYTAQQLQAPARSREASNESVDASRSAEPRRGDNVSFSSESLRLSAQNDQENSRNTVTRSSESAATDRQLQQQQQAANPEVTRAEGAKSVAQAINAYRDTSII